jgi:redox-sensitive bicupin YhaK (pirin superfamily)
MGIHDASDVTRLMLNGRPIDEPVVAYGPSVMNSNAEIQKAIRDVESGRIGHIERVRASASPYQEMERTR